MFKLLSDADKTARAELRNAYRALAATAGGREETVEYLDANDRVIRAERALPWWKRLDIDLLAR